MISKFKMICLSIMCFFYSNPGMLRADQAKRNVLIEKVVITGLIRTNAAWLKEYLGLGVMPLEMSRDSAQLMADRLMKSGIFEKIEVELVSKGNEETSSKILLISCDEKWTTVPVLRAEYGGGTPMYVMGLYDINSFGRLFTLGAEMRQFGPDAPGGVAYLRTPYLFSPGQSFAIDYWSETRTRSFYDLKGSELAKSKRKYSKFHSQLLLPSEFILSGLKLGFDFNIYHTTSEDFETYTENESVLRRLKLIEPITKFVQESTLMSMVSFDNIRRSTLDNHGLRLLLKLGAHRNRMRWDPASELEVFYYRPLGSSLNMMLHGFASSTKSRSPSMLQFLGGFNSVRGIQDGAMYGHHAMYSNIELRRIFYKSQFLWIQVVSFVDSGVAVDSLNSKQANDYQQFAASSLGGGLRLAVPQVYRLVFRIDFAISMQNPSQRGFSLGLNHFVQPYKPL